MLEHEVGPAEGGGGEQGGRAAQRPGQPEGQQQHARGDRDHGQGRPAARLGPVTANMAAATAL